MTEPRDMERFEARIADRARAYTDPAVDRPLDAIALARAAMAAQPATGWSRRLGAGQLGRQLAGDRWAATFVAVLLIGVIGVAVVGRLSNAVIGPQATPAISSTPSAVAGPAGPIPDVLRHAWARPYAVTPDLDQWATGFLSFASDAMDFGPAPGAGASRSAITAAGPDTLLVTATAETQGCAVGDIGAYRWVVAGQDTVMTLTAINPDACTAREKALAGDWVRSDLPVSAPGGASLAPGPHLTSAFDPFGGPGTTGQLSFAVPDGWNVIEDQPASFVLQHPSDASPLQATNESFIFLLGQPRMAAEVVKGTPCGPSSVAPGVGHGVDDIVTAIRAMDGVVSTTPRTVTIGGYDGQLLDLHLAPSWTGGCQAPEGHPEGIAILQSGSGTGPVLGVGTDRPMRLILLDLTGGRTLAVAVACVASDAPTFVERVAAAMPIIDSFEFHPPAGR